MTVTKIDCPEQWESTHDWDSHRGLVYLSLRHTSGVIVEVGMGFGSSPLISWDAYYDNRKFLAFENNRDYYENVSMKASGDTTVTILCKYFISAINDEIKDGRIGLLFIDCAPGEIRKDLIKEYQNRADVILVHDTEEGAEYVYGMKEIISTFKYRLDYEPEGKPRTTAVSNYVNLDEWI